MNDFIALVKEGFRLAWNLGQLALDAVKAAVLAYFRGVKKWSIRFFIAAVAPLVVIVPCLVFHVPFGGLYGAYVVWLVLLFAAELILITPMFLIWRRLKVLFPTVAHDLTDWVEFIKSVLFNGLALGIFVTLFPIWRSPGAFPLLLLVLVCWLTLPACAFSAFCKRIYPTVRGIQLLVLFGLLVLQMAFPRQMEQLGWASGRKIGGILTASVTQREITSNWNTMPWFNNVGEPLAWYSGSDSESYRLWAAPGFDPDSGKELQPVRDEKTRTKIVASLTARARTLQEQKAAEQAETARKEAARLREADRIAAEQAAAQQARLEKERAAAAQSAAEQAAAQHASYLTRYIGTSEPRKTGGKQTLAVVAVSENGKLNSNVGQVIAGVLKTETLEVTTSRFTPEFVSDGLFAQAFGDSRPILKKLELTDSLGALLLARQTVHYSTNASLENLITANMRLEVQAVAVADSGVGKSLTITASGVGFKPDDARSQAEERLSKKIQAEADSLRNATRPNSQ